MKTYEGIQLTSTCKHVKMAHSRFFETNEGIDFFEKLIECDKKKLSKEQFRTISSLNSVANANYQICNGGLYQYFDNGYHWERAPFNEDDVMRVNQEEQVAMMRNLLSFGRTVFPERELDNERLERIIAEFSEAYYEEPSCNWYDEEDEEYTEGGLVAPYDFDSRYYRVNEYLELLIEAYSEFLVKTLRL